jgi:hypothetical protein
MTRFVLFSYFLHLLERQSKPSNCLLGYAEQDALQPNIVHNMNIDRIGEALAGRAAEDLRDRLAIRSFTDCLTA